MRRTRCVYLCDADAKHLNLQFTQELRFGKKSLEDIYLLETRAAHAALSDPRLIALLEVPHRLDIIVDNAGLAYALRSGMTSSDAAQQLLNGIMEHLASGHVTLVISADNPADVPSRVDDPKFRRMSREAVQRDFERRTEQMAQALRAADRGWSWGSEKVSTWYTKRLDAEGGRHSDPGLLPPEPELPSDGEDS